MAGLTEKRREVKAERKREVSSGHHHGPFVWSFRWEKPGAVDQDTPSFDLDVMDTDLEMILRPGILFA